MKKLLCLLVLVHGISAYAQSGDRPDTNGATGNHPGKIVVDDSAILRVQQRTDSALTTLRLADSTEISENISRNVNSIFELQRDRNAKEKKAAMIRIGIGLALLALLIFSWIRRRKK